MRKIVGQAFNPDGKGGGYFTPVMECSACKKNVCILFPTGPQTPHETHWFSC